MGGDDAAAAAPVKKRSKKKRRVYWLPCQEACDQFYNSLKVQTVVALLIGANFLTNIVEKEIDPSGEKHRDVFKWFELFYNISFTIELIINMYAHWFWNFWSSRWNVFDVVVVSIGILNTVEEIFDDLDLPDWLSLLRMMRAFRVFRLFKRVESLNKIIVAIMHAIPGVLNAFLILTIVMSVYAIFAVEFYYELGDNCRLGIPNTAWLYNARDNCVGYEYFGTFFRSLYTFFQCLTGESWSEAVARPAIWRYAKNPRTNNEDSWHLTIGGGFFFITYILITGFILTNVVVAVLVDKFTSSEVAEECEDEEEEQQPGETTSEVSTSTKVPEKPPPENPVQLRSRLDTVEKQVDQLMDTSERMATEVDTVSSDLTSMLEQLTKLLQCVPGGELR